MQLYSFFILRGFAPHCFTNSNYPSHANLLTGGTNLPACQGYNQRTLEGRARQNLGTLDGEWRLAGGDGDVGLGRGEGAILQFNRNLHGPSTRAYNKLPATSSYTRRTLISSVEWHHMAQRAFENTRLIVIHTVNPRLLNEIVSHMSWRAFSARAYHAPTASMSFSAIEAH